MSLGCLQDMTSTPMTKSDVLPGDAMRVLLIEDDPLVLRHLTALFEAHGHDVIGCSQATTALAMAMREPVDLVCVDLNLPDMDGLKVIHFVRTQAAHLPIFVVTGRVRADIERQCLDVGASMVFSKPLDESTFMREVERVQQSRLSITVGIVDDNPATASRLRDVLMREGCDVVTFGAHAPAADFDLSRLTVLVVDDASPDASALLRWGATQQRPVIVTRNDARAAVDEAFLREGAALIMRRPLDEHRLMAHLSFLCC